MIPESRIMEMDNNLFLIHFKTENEERENEKPEGDEGKGDSSEGEEENQEEESEKTFEAVGKEAKDRKDNSKDNADKDRSKGGALGSGKSTQRINSVARTLLFAEDKENQGSTREGRELYGGVNLLQAMEVEEPGEVEQEGDDEEEEGFLLPEEWVYSMSNTESEGGTVLEQNRELDRREEEDGGMTRQIKKDQGAGEKKWGPVVVERRSKRHVEDGKTVLEKAQDTKRKWNEGARTGITKPKHNLVTYDDLRSSALFFGIVHKDGNPVNNRVIKEIEKSEIDRNRVYSDSCSHELCIGEKEDGFCGTQESEPDNTGDAVDFERIKNRVESSVISGRIGCRSKRNK
jgi:hypothetical protein